MSASLSRLLSFYGSLKPSLLLHAMIKREFSGNIALMSPLKPDSEPFLRMIAEIDPTLAVLWLDNGAATPSVQPQDCGFLQTSAVKISPDSIITAIEDRGLLAIIMEDVKTTSRQRIELDEQGVFRIYPLAGEHVIDDTAANWTV